MFGEPPKNVTLLAAQSLKHGAAACYVTRTVISAVLSLGSQALYSLTTRRSRSKTSIRHRTFSGEPSSSVDTAMSPAIRA